MSSVADGGTLVGESILGSHCTYLAYTIPLGLLMNRKISCGPLLQGQIGKATHSRGRTMQMQHLNGGKEREPSPSAETSIQPFPGPGIPSSGRSEVCQVACAFLSCHCWNQLLLSSGLSTERELNESRKHEEHVLYLHCHSKSFSGNFSDFLPYRRDHYPRLDRCPRYCSRSHSNLLEFHLELPTFSWRTSDSTVRAGT